MAENDQDIERLLVVAGQRKSPPEDMQTRVYASTLAAWQALPTQEPPPSRARAVGWLAAVATSVIALVAFTAWLAQPVSVVSEVAELTFVRGALRADGESLTAVGARFVPGSKLATSSTDLASIRFANGARLVLDVATQAVVRENNISLLAGRVYVDAEGTAELTVITPDLEVRDIGTQFEVGLDMSGSTWVGLRHGRVDIQTANAVLPLQAHDGVGELAHFNGAAVISKHTVASTDVRWDWQRQGRAPLLLSGTSVYDYLRWMSRDTGYELRFSSRAVEQMARMEHLGGEGRTSDETTLDETLRTTQFDLKAVGAHTWMVNLRGA